MKRIMNSTHNLEFIERFKPIADGHTLKIDMATIDRETWQDIAQALTEVGLRFHLHNTAHRCDLHFDKHAFDMLCDYHDTMRSSVSSTDTAYLPAA
jgi:hypothetical protein